MKLKIRGRKKFQGEIHITGAKNSAVAVIPASILCSDNVILRNIPDISDVRILLEILEEIGYHIVFKNNCLFINKMKRVNHIITDERIKKLRGSYYFYGAFLGKCRKIKTYLPGGCKIGKRPIDYHLEGFEKLNCTYNISNNIIEIKAKKIKGNVIDLKYPSVGATINILLAAVKAKGLTIISNCATEPEVEDVCNFLKSMGANIKGIGTEKLEIIGVKKLHSTDYTIINDRIEAGSYLIMGGLGKGTGLNVIGAQPKHLQSLITVLEKMGFILDIKDNSIKINRPDKLYPIDIITGPYPLFPTDLAQPLTSLLLSIEGTSSITEEIFDNRFSHIDELKKMGANITLNNKTYTIIGQSKLKPTLINACDLRGAFALVLAGIQTYGITTIDNINYLFRGYDSPLEKLKKLGFTADLED